MGDRANVKIVDIQYGSVFLYTHWEGTELPTTIQTAMRNGQSRWKDTQYLTRILFCEMVKGQETGFTGFGISHKVGDGASRILTVDCDLQEVSFPDGRKMSFQTFIDTEGVHW